MKKLIPIVAFFFVSCSSRLDNPKPINVITLLDLSISRDSSIAKWYRDITKEIVLGNLHPTSCFTAIPIDHGSESSSEELYYKNFNSHNYHSDYAGLQDDELAQKHHRDSLKSAGKHFVICFDSACISRKNLSNGTDITGALKVGKKYKKEGARNIIIIMADMLHCVKEQHIDFEKKLNCKNDADSLLIKVERIDLAGFEVIVLTGKQSHINTVKYSAVQRFWEEYFKNCNARLINYSSGSVSKLAEILKGEDKDKL